VGVNSACRLTQLVNQQVGWDSSPMSEDFQNQDSPIDDSVTLARDLSHLSAVEIVGLHSTDLMTACAIKLGLYEGTERDLAEARILIDVLGGFTDAAARNIGHHHAAPLRDGLSSLQKAFREYSVIQDEAGAGPGERYTGYVAPSPRPSV